LRRRLAAINPFAMCVTAVDGELDPDLLAHISPRTVGARQEELNRWLMPSDADPPMPSRHDGAIRSFCLRFDRAFTWESLDAALHALSQLRGPDLLRVKGIVRVEGEPGPVVVQGAQHLFHPPVTLRGRSEIEAGSRIVFIVRNITRESIERLFAAVQALGAAP
jgi:G3E family GTPase